MVSMVSSILVGETLDRIDDYRAGQGSSDHHPQREAKTAPQSAAEHEPRPGG
jgi:hypothetical protein